MEEAHSLANSDLKKARELALAGLALAEDEQNTTLIRTALKTLADNGIKQADHGNAKEYAQRLYELSLEASDTAGEANALHFMGMIATLSGNYSTGMKHFYSALHIYQSLNDLDGQARIQTNIGNTHYLAGNENHALEAYLFALEIQRTLSNRQSIATISSNIGAILTEYDQYDDALKYLEDSLGILRTLSNPIGLSNALLHLSRVYFKQKDYPKVSEICREVYDMRKSSGFTAGMLEVLESLLDLAVATNDTESLYRYKEEYKEVVQTLKSPATSVRALIQSGKIAQHLGNHKEGIQLFREALAVIETSMPEEVRKTSLAHLGLAESYEAIGDTALALRHCRAGYDMRASLINSLTKNQLHIIEQVQATKRLHQQNEAAHIKNQALAAYNAELTESRAQLHSELIERRQLEMRLKKYGDLVSSLNATLTMFIANEYAPRQMWNKMLDILLSVSESEYGLIGRILLSDDGKPYLRTFTITNNAWNAETQKFYEDNELNGLEFHNLSTLFGQVISSGTPVISNNPAMDPRSGGIPAEHPRLDSFLGVPIYYGNNLVGMFGIANRPNGYSEEIIEFLQPLTSTLSFIIKNAQEAEAKEKMHRALEASEAKFRVIFDSLPIGVAITDDAGNILDCNPACETLTGFTKSELQQGDHITNKVIIRPDGSEMPSEEMALNRVIAERKAITDVESGVVLPSGEIHWLSINASPIQLEGYGIVVSYVDISRRKIVEDLLKAQGQYLDGVFNGVDVAIFVVDVEQNGEVFRLNSANNTYERYNGVPNSELIGKTMEELRPYFTEESTTTLLKYYHQCYTTGKPLEYEDMSPINGHEAWWLTRLTPLLHENGSVYRIIGAASLITERVITEQKLREMNARLEDINSELDLRVKERTMELQRALEAEKELNILRDTFAGVIAHQFRTPLTVILSSAEILKLYGNSLPPDKLERLFHRVFGAITAIQNLLDAIRKVEEVSDKIRTMRIAPLNCTFLLQTTIDNFKATMEKTHTILLTVPETLIVLADEFMLRTIIVELLSNAVRYSAVGTEITVTAGREKHYIVIRVEDRGIGIEPAEINRIFEAFYRPKETENVFGAGLGLAIVKRYTAAMHGWIACESTPNVGTVFTIRLPLSNHT